MLYTYYEIIHDNRHIRIGYECSSCALSCFPSWAVKCLLLLTMSLAAAHRHLWFDELFTFYVSRLETPLIVLHALLDKAEELPPVDFLLRNISMQLFGESHGLFVFRPW